MPYKAEIMSSREGWPTEKRTCRLCRGSRYSELEAELSSIESEGSIFARGKAPGSKVMGG